MEIRINEKGKYFTPHVNKEPVRALVQTADQLLVGTLYTHVEKRLKDDLNTSSERFLALTDVQVYTKDAGRLLYVSSLVLVGYTHIVAISPLEGLGSAEGLPALHALLKEAQ